MSPWASAGPLDRLWAAPDVALAVGARGAIARSTDAGASWEAASSPVTETLRAIGGGARGDLYAGGDGGALARSRDRGRTWETITAPTRGATAALWTSDEGRVVLAATPEGIFRGERGAGWKRVLDAAQCPEVGGLVDDGTRVWALGDRCLARSIDGGARWTVEHPPARTVALWREGEELVALDDSGAMTRSRDGATWQPARRVEHAVAAWGDESGTIVVGESGSIRRSLDHDRHFSERNRYVTPVTLRAVTAARGALLVTGDDGVIRRSVDGGTTWQLANALTDVEMREALIDLDGGLRVYGQSIQDGRREILRSGDGGASWTPVDEFPRHRIPWGDPDFIVLDRECTDGSGRRYATGSWDVYVSDDGKDWSRTKAGEALGSPEGLHCGPDGLVVAISDRRVARSSDRGETWTAREHVELGDVAGIAGSGGAVVIAGAEGAFRSTDGGETFTRILEPRRWTAVAEQGGVIWLLADGVVARSRDGGASFALETIPADRADTLLLDGRGGAIVLGYPATILRYGLPVAASRPAPLALAPAGPPFAPAVAALATREEADARRIEARAAWLAPQIMPLLARLRLDGPSPRVDGLVALDASLAQVAKVAAIGKRECFGVVERYCPARTFSAPLRPRAGALDERWTSYFAGGKLYSLENRVELAQRDEPDDERRIAMRTVEALVISVLGDPVSIQHTPSDPDSEEPLSATFLRYPQVDVLSDVATRTVLVRVTGASIALADALQEKDIAAQEAEEARRLERERKKLCTCRHLTVGMEWPSNRHHVSYDDQPRYRILELTPKTCTARAEHLTPTQRGQPASLKCSDIVIPRACPSCGPSR